MSRPTPTPVHHFHLKDYLKPKGTKPYDQLHEDIEAIRKQGFVVYLWSVPNSMMLAGYPDTEHGPNLEPYYHNGYEYKTAKDCINNTNGTKY